MAQEEGGWPLGLQPVNVRAGIIRNSDSYGSISFNTLISASPTSSTDSSSDLDTESAGSLFHERRSITLGSLIGITNILELSSRSFRSRRQDTAKCKKNKNSNDKKKRQRTRLLCFSLCSKSHVETGNAVPSLGHFLEVERRASDVHGRDRSGGGGGGGPCSITYELQGLLEAESAVEDNNNSLLFSNGSIAAPPPALPPLQSDTNGSSGRSATASGIQLRLPCIGGSHDNSN